jgi:hypothetical protein
VGDETQSGHDDKGWQLFFYLSLSQPSNSAQQLHICLSRTPTLGEEQKSIKQHDRDGALWEAGGIRAIKQLKDVRSFFSWFLHNEQLLMVKRMVGDVPMCLCNPPPCTCSCCHDSFQGEGEH